MRPAVAAILKRLLQKAGPVLSLDLIGETIGTEAISTSEIDDLFESLERAGRTIGTLAPNIREHLGLVLREARNLRSAKNATPDVAAIAQATGLTPESVRAALLYATVLSR
jgi:hypothetical protein